MREDLATANINRSYSLAATSIAVFTFMLFFLYPRFASGEVDASLFQTTLAVMVAHPRGLAEDGPIYLPRVELTPLECRT